MMGMLPPALSFIACFGQWEIVVVDMLDVFKSNT